MVSLVSGLAIGTVLFAQGFNARTGTWEFTIVMKGNMPMDGVPPEMAASILAELSKPQKSTSCLTAEDLKNLNLGKTGANDNEDCKVLSAKITSTVADITRQCTDPAFTETAHFEAPNPQTVTGTISQKRAEGTMTITMNGKWVAAACME